MRFWHPLPPVYHPTQDRLVGTAELLARERDRGEPRRPAQPRRRWFDTVLSEASVRTAIPPRLPRPLAPPIRRGAV